MSPMLELDHIAISAPSLEAGRSAVEAALGVPLQAGGQHAHFGTHNLLLGLEDGLYLEVIAIDPDAPPPAFPRWFGLDRFSGPPRLTNWICRAADLAGAVSRIPQAGQPVALSRGDLRWQMAVPSDGWLPYDNCFPALIEWQCAEHPAQRLEPSGCRLQRLVVRHPEARALKTALGAHLLDPRIDFETDEAGLMAEIATPDGMMVLS